MIVAFGSLLIAGVAVAVAYRANGYVKGPSDAAERQAPAAEAQVEYMRRQVDVMERDAVSSPRRREGNPTAATDSHGDGEGVRGAPYVPPWSLRRTGQHAFVLLNGGTEPAFDVRLEFDVEPARAEPTAWNQIEARAGMRLMVVRSFQAPPSEVTVRWRRTPDGNEHNWTSSLP